MTLTPGDVAPALTKVAAGLNGNRWMDRHCTPAHKADGRITKAIIYTNRQELVMTADEKVLSDDTLSHFRGPIRPLSTSHTYI